MIDNQFKNVSFICQASYNTKNLKSIVLICYKVPKGKYASTLPPHHHMSVHFTGYLGPVIYQRKIAGILGVKIPGILIIKIPAISIYKISGIFT